MIKFYDFACVNCSMTGDHGMPLVQKGKKVAELLVT